MSCACEIVPVSTGAQIADVRRLFQEYWDSFGFTPCFQNFGAELDSLPGKYAPPEGRLALASIDDEPAGCAAVSARAASSASSRVPR